MFWTCCFELLLEGQVEKSSRQFDTGYIGAQRIKTEIQIWEYLKLDSLENKPEVTAYVLVLYWGMKS